MRAHTRSTIVFAGMLLALGSAPVIAAEGPAASADTPAHAATKVSVQVLGRVRNPGSYALDPGARLSDALTAAGAYSIEALIARLGGTPVADQECVPGGARLRFVYLTHIAVNSPNRAVTQIVDVAVARQQHDARYDPPLQQNDKIFVPECRPAGAPILVPPTFPRDDGLATERAGAARTPTNAP